MQTSVLSSTALLTALLAIGLLFFIRASTKDRIERLQFISDREEVSTLEWLQPYFTERAYRVVAMDAAEQRITFEGLVSPSVFLAVFLSLLAAIGILCLALVLALLFPNYANLFPALVVFAPVAGIFYWRKSARPERVLLQVQPVASDQQPAQSLVTVTAHRDELAELQRSLAVKPLETPAE
jgi:hypothetical protein